MLKLQSSVCISAVFLMVISFTLSQEDCVFAVDPEDTTLIFDGNVTLHCQPNSETDLIVWEVFLRNGTSWSITADDLELQRTRSIEFIPLTQSLRIIQAQAFHTGIYRCEGRDLAGKCLYFSENATVTVKGPATIEIMNGPQFAVNTTEKLQVTGTINGQPDPEVTLWKVEGGHEVIVSNDHPRIAVNFVFINLVITLENVQVSDSGLYRVNATNEYGSNCAEFVIATQGPDPPYISVQKIIVTEIHQLVRVPCSVQKTALDNTSWLELNWRANGTIITSTPSSIYIRQDSNVSVTLIIRNFTYSEYRATCVASNIRNSSYMETIIYVPPIPPKPTVTEASHSGAYNISWKHIVTDVPIVMYTIIIVEAGSDEYESSNVSAEVGDDGFINFEVPMLSAGEYEVRVVTVARAGNSVAMSVPSPPARFRVQASVQGVQASDTIPIAVIGAVAGSVGVLILIVAGVFVGAFFLCFYSHRRQMNSQQQRWGSEEDKVDSFVPNTYTTLALHPGNTELPPSPSTPLISSFFSTDIDPKWEFPRENLQLKDVLYEGQFTILYKGTMKGVKERMIEVAIKSVRDDANEDDVKALVSEMETLAGLGQHPNIISLIRVCTVGNPMYVVMEYMCHGDLLGFLRASRGHHGLYHISPGIRYQPPTFNLCSRDLLNVAAKIANGMRYLADRKVVHRALCAKNILVGPGMDIKIYNVGSFDISFENREYLMKWMAPETLFDHTTTTYSDVWSYGVTLWELVTVGGTPYAEILSQDLYSQLHNGMRMPKPQHCAQEVYDVMWQCWQRNPTDRPHFAVIHENIEELLESKISYVDLRQYDEYSYSQFDDAHPQLSTAL